MMPSLALQWTLSTPAIMQSLNLGQGLPSIFMGRSYKLTHIQPQTITGCFDKS